MEKLSLSSCGCDLSAYHRKGANIIEVATNRMEVGPDIVYIDPIEQVVLKPEAKKQYHIEAMDCVEPF